MINILSIIVSCLSQISEECYNRHYIFIFRKEAIMERIQDLVYTHVQGGQFRWVTVSTLMLALGTILHLVSPSVAGVTPNWTIATYCVAILLTRPSLSHHPRHGEASSTYGCCL